MGTGETRMGFDESYLVLLSIPNDSPLVHGSRCSKIFAKQDNVISLPIPSFSLFTAALKWRPIPRPVSDFIPATSREVCPSLAQKERDSG